jgi:16S rRNA processing protein RimM
MVRVGRVAGVFGIRGAVKVQPLTDFEDRFTPGAQLSLDGVERRVEWSRTQSAALVVKLAGIDTRNDAERLRGAYLEVAAARSLPEGSWYWDDLVGLDVVTEEGRELGTLEEVLERPANDVWVARRDGVETLVPVVRDAIRSVDLASRRVTVAGWLLDVEDA